ncbi:MAG: FKBP-type peptidyl-prolyl cis-trans isomerase [Bacteroides sp.]|nr:FKBP-type peptidyl-prolyl cis-trans isomerase [Bacteroides sp.]
MAKQEYIKANREWLENKSKEAGVLPLPKGIFYKVVKQGDKKGAQPTARSIVTAHYTGWTINGKKFDSSRGGVPLACRLCDLIEGWIIAMQQMHVGDKWEVYIPAEMGYGKFSQPGIPGGSTLIFEIELMGIG